MDRSAQILQIGKELLSETVQERSKALGDFSGKEWSNCKNVLFKKINQLFVETVIAQKKTKKNPIRYLLISPLESSRIIGTYEYQIALYDKRFYLDDHDSSLYWCPDFLFQHFKHDLDYFSKKIRNKVVRVREDEILAFSHAYIHFYEAFAAEFFRKVANEIQHIENYPKITKESAVEILYGGYMDKAETIAVLTEELKKP